jgi:hypothetical protein
MDKTFTFYAECFTYQNKVKKVKVVQDGADRKSALEDAMLKVSHDESFMVYAEVSMYGIKLIANI